MHHPTDRITHTMAFVTPVVEHCLERDITQWVHTMSECSYHGATSRSILLKIRTYCCMVLQCWEGLSQMLAEFWGYQAIVVAIRQIVNIHYPLKNH